jgi:hypothetical protein
MRTIHPLNLRVSVILRVALCALACALAAAVFVIADIRLEMNRALRAKAERIAGKLNLQAVRFQTEFEHDERLPDWRFLADRLLDEGSCIRFENADNQQVYASCVGLSGSANAAPPWFSTLYSIFFSPFGPVRQKAFRHHPDRRPSAGSGVMAQKIRVMLVDITQSCSKVIAVFLRSRRALWSSQRLPTAKPPISATRKFVLTSSSSIFPCQDAGGSISSDSFGHGTPLSVSWCSLCIASRSMRDAPSRREQKDMSQKAATLCCLWMQSPMCSPEERRLAGRRPGAGA